MNPISASPISDPRIGFPSGFIETNIEYPPDGVNGDSVVHFGGDYSKYKMFVKLVNGKREGKAIIVSEAYEYIKLEYQNGKLTGEVVKLDRYLNVLLKGVLVNGKEKGVFVEYDNDSPVWRGYYLNGKRFSTVERSTILRHYYEERSVQDQILLSIAQYDDSLCDKNGYCFEFEDGVVKRECVYENGVRKQIIQEYRDDEPSHYENRKPLQKSFLSILFDTPGDDSMILYQMSNESGFGVKRLREKCYGFQWGPNEDRVIEVDLISHKVNEYQGTRRIDVPCDRGVLDLNVKGRRWEGSVRKEKPYGYGTLFDDEGSEEYQGFMINQTKVCYGQEYYSDIKNLKYAGCYYEGKRYGYGVLFDRKGAIDHEGLWKDDKPYVSECNGNSIDNNTELIDSSNFGFVGLKSFRVPHAFDILKQIVIADNSLHDVRLFEMNGLRELKSIVVGNSCFTVTRGWNGPITNTTYCVFQVTNCPKLQSIQIGDKSFSDFDSFVLRNLPSLQSISMDDACFVHVPLFALIGHVERLI